MREEAGHARSGEERYSVARQLHAHVCACRANFLRPLVIPSIHAALLPVADEEAHIFKKGSTLLKTRVVGTWCRVGGDLASSLSAYGHVLRSSRVATPSTRDRCDFLNALSRSFLFSTMGILESIGGRIPLTMDQLSRHQCYQRRHLMSSRIIILPQSCCEVPTGSPTSLRRKVRLQCTSTTPMTRTHLIVSSH